MMERKGKVSFTLSNREIAAKMNMSDRSIRSGRTQVKEFGLITFVREPDGRYTYTMCDPDTGSPLEQPFRPLRRGPSGGNSGTPVAAKVRGLPLDFNK